MFNQLLLLLFFGLVLRFWCFLEVLIWAGFFGGFGVSVLPRLVIVAYVFGCSLSCCLSAGHEIIHLNKFYIVSSFDLVLWSLRGHLRLFLWGSMVLWFLVY